MATKAEQFHAEEQRRGGGGARRGKNKSGSKPGSPPRARSPEKTHAGKKATHALERTAKGQRPSRKSTRKSANRAKPDATFNRQEQQRKGSPEARFHKAAARASRVRGS